MQELVLLHGSCARTHTHTVLLSRILTSFTSPNAFFFIFVLMNYTTSYTETEKHVSQAKNKFIGPPFQKS